MPSPTPPTVSTDGTWSPKQLLGHLIDSAANNHQRFVRTALAATVQSPPYAQDAWVDTQAYANADWDDLIDLWRSYNIHLLHIIDHLPAPTYDHRCQIGTDEPVTLDFLIRDYLKHLQGHLEELLPKAQW